MNRVISSCLYLTKTGRYNSVSRREGTVTEGNSPLALPINLAF